MFHLALPWILLALPLPWLVWRFLPKASIKQPGALKVPFFFALKTIVTETQMRASMPGWRLILAFIIWGLLVFAAAGPQWLGKPIAVERQGRDVMLAIDLSGSMEIPDLTLDGKKANRLAVVKSVAKKFIQDRLGDRVGLILFGTKAYLQTPLTYDRKTVEQMLGDATIGLAGKLTAIGDAIGLGVKRLLKVPDQSRILVLLTDGVSNAGVVTPLQAAKIAAKEHVKIYTIGVGADRLVINGMFGPQVIDPSQDLDEAALKQIAKITGGQYFRAKDTKALEKAYSTIDKLEPVESGKQVFRPITPLYIWPLGLALLLSFFIALRQTGFFKRKASQVELATFPPAGE